MSLIGHHTLNPITDAHELTRRAFCSDTGHQPVTYNPIHSATWCTCGEVVTAGDHGVLPRESATVQAAWLLALNDITDEQYDTATALMRRYRITADDLNAL